MQSEPRKQASGYYQNQLQKIIEEFTGLMIHLNGLRSSCAFTSERDILQYQIDYYQYE